MSNDITDLINVQIANETGWTEHNAPTEGLKTALRGIRLAREATYSTPAEEEQAVFVQARLFIKALREEYFKS